MFDQFLTSTQPDPHCVACSPTVCEAYQSQGFALVEHVCNQPTYLEQLTGLAETQASYAALMENDAEKWIMGADDDEEEL